MSIAGDLLAHRKDSHLELCLTRKVEARDFGFAAYRFDHDAIPELDFDRISLECELFGRRLAAPLIIGAMTGGTARAAELNRRLAWAAERTGVGLALGSQRKMLVNPGDPEIRASYCLRDRAPGLRLLFGNLGAVQLNCGVKPAQVRELVRETGCDAFNFHLNPLQEAIQPEGDRCFADLLPRLRECMGELPVPALVKEVGAGISARAAIKLRELPIRGIETAGVGGTSWARIEGMRSQEPARRAAGELFARWGVPTAESVRICRAEFPDRVVIASGGIRSGIDAAKAIALGADAVAIALPILKAAEESAEEAARAIEQLLFELRVAMFASGFGSVERLRAEGLSALREVQDQNG